MQREAVCQEGVQISQSSINLHQAMVKYED